jgi:hypothetical protein
MLTHTHSRPGREKLGQEPRKKLQSIRIDALVSRQPLVKGERLIRYEASAAMP